jgi:YgiT-type zinc finger domain-containing protein
MSRCFRCGSTDIRERLVEEHVRQGRYVVALQIPAEACSNCGERYFSRDHAEHIEDVRRRLENQELSGFRVSGTLLEPVEREEER